MVDFTSIVCIVKTTSEGTKSVGTGFFIEKPGHILSCYHVLQKAGCSSVGNSIGFMFEGRTQVFSACLHMFDLVVDAAILYTELVQTKGYSFSHSREVGDIFNTLGFPEGSLNGVVAHPSIERMSPDGLIELKNSNEMCPGYSGAPLLDNNGSIAGMVRIIPQSLRTSGSMLGVARAIPIEVITKIFPSEFSALKQRSQNCFSNAEITSLSNIVGGQSVASELEQKTPSRKTKTSPSKKTDQGRQSQNFGNIAEETFHDLMQIWLANTGISPPTHLIPDTQKIDFVVDLPSLRSGMTSIQTFWQIKSSSQRLKKYIHSEVGSMCFHLTFPKKTISVMKELALQHEHFYLAFAHNPSNMLPSDLYRLTPQERFEWYCVDLKQQLAGDEVKDFIIIPEQNTLNLSTFSLLWSSLWVEKFYAPLFGRNTIDIPNLMDIIRLTHPYQNEPILELGDWNALTKKLSNCERELGKDNYSKIGFPLGIGYALEIIKKKLYDVSSNLNVIQTYCPESLYGTVNLWLFARSYHGFMTASGQVVNLGKNNNNLRILPLPDDPQKISELVKACLWHVVLLYSSMNVEVRIVYRPLLDAGIDHSYYGGGIGYFPWLSLSDDGITWMMENSVDTTNGQHRDFINQHMDSLFITPYHSNKWEVAKALKLHPNDLDTAPICPVQLFPEKGRFIDYPHFIFGTNAVRSIYSVKQKLS